MQLSSKLLRTKRSTLFFTDILPGQPQELETTLISDTMFTLEWQHASQAIKSKPKGYKITVNRLQ